MLGAMITHLEHGLAMIRATVEGIEEAEARWKPESGAWSVLEIINHLADEESEDFRTRFQMTIEDPSQEWPGIDPEAQAVSRCYNDRDWKESIERFVTAREESLYWLRSLDIREVDLNAARTHPVAGTLHAGDLLASWAAHDLLHLRQIVKRRFEYLTRNAEPYRTTYAGSW